MPIYSYRARTAGGHAERGIVDAESLRAAWQRLRGRGVFPVDLRAADAPAHATGRIDPGALAPTTRQLASLAAAGVPVAEALESLADEAPPALGHALTVARARLREGVGLADALAASPRVFSPMYRELVRVGEASGALGPVLARLARELEASAARSAQVRAALLYPAVVTVTTAAVLVFLLVWVVPEVTRLFAESGQRLPLATRLLLAAATGLARTWWVWPLGAAAAVVGARRWYATPPGRAALDGLALRLPGLGGVVRGAVTARLARTLATVLAHGLPLDDGLAMAAAAAGNASVAGRVARVREAVRRGEALAPALRAEDLFPPTTCRLISTGERTGALADAFAHTADALDAELDRTLGAALRLLEPALVVLMGGAVLFLVLAILVPILTLNPVGGRP